MNNDKMMVKSAAHVEIRRSILEIIGGVIGLAASAQIVIYVFPVPITLQTLVVMIVGLTYRSSNALMTILSYLCIGACGVTVFSNFNAGISYLFGPTFGYLIGFLMAVYVMTMGRKYWTDKSFKNAFFLCLLGNFCIYCCGVSWLIAVQMMGIYAALYSGFIVFIPSGVVKIILLSTIFKYFITNNVK